MIKLVVSALPNLSELFKPFVNFFHFVSIELIVNFPARVLLVKKLALGQYAQVF